MPAGIPITSSTAEAASCPSWHAEPVEAALGAEFVGGGAVPVLLSHGAMGLPVRELSVRRGRRAIAKRRGR